MNPEEEISALEQIIDEILKGIQDTMQSGEILSDEFQAMLAEELTHATDRISQLYQEVQQQKELQQAEMEQAEVAEAITPEAQPSQPTGGEIPELEQAPHESSNINAFRYDPKTQKLFVKFQGKYPAQNGPVYSYEGVPAHIYDVFRRGAVAPKTSGKNAWHTWNKNVAPSHGASMYALIRNGGYQYQRMS